MKDRHACTPGSSFHAGSVGSFRYAVEMTSFAFCKPAGFSTLATDVDTFATKNLGFQPISPTFLMACAEPFGAANEKRVLAPESRRVTTCESMDGSVTSYDLSAMIMLALSPSPSRSPLN